MYQISRECDKISILGSYRCSGISSASGNKYSDRVINVQGYKPSGAEGGIILGMALFVYSGSEYDDGDWVPLRREWL